MNNYSVEVVLEKLTCRDTESIHSSDKFALAGAVFTDIDSAGIILPLMRINSGENRLLQRQVFNAGSTFAKVGINLQAWDIDENDSWTQNEDEIVAIAAAIAQGVKLVPEYGTIIGLVLDGVNTVVPKVVDQFISFDKSDQLLSYSAWIDLPVQGSYVPTEKRFSIDFKRDDWSGYSSFDYTIEISVRCTWMPSLSTQTPTPKEPESKSAMRMFRHRADIASSQGFVGAFPNFHEAHYGISHVGGTIFLNASASEWRDVSLGELGNPNLEDFGARMRATQDYAIRNGFVGGFPNFYHAVYPGFSVFLFGGAISITVCGTVLLKSGCAIWRDVPLSELGNPALEDIGARFRATNDYAVDNMFLGGFPNFYHADHGQGIVCGTILIKPGCGEWRDVLLFADPR